MQTKIIALLIALPLVSLAATQSAFFRGGAQFTSRNPVPPQVATDKNIGDRAELERANARAVPSSQAFLRARRLLSQGKFKEAEKECRLADALYPTLPGKPRQPWQSGLYRGLMGDILLEQGRNEEALQFYLPRPDKKQNSTDPKSQRYLLSRTQVNLNAALAYCRLSDFKMAKKYAPDSVVNRAGRKSSNEWPGTSDLRSLEATLMLRRGFEKSSYVAEEEAVREYRKVLKMFPQNAVAAYRCARSLMRLKRYDEALPMFARAVQFGEGKRAKDAKWRMSGWPKARRDAAMRQAEKL